MYKLTSVLLLLVLLLFVSTLAALGQQKEVLSNAEIIEMTRAGLTQSVVLAKVRGSDGRYDVSVAALVEMKKAGVSDDVITALLESKPAPPVETGSIENPGIAEKRASPVFTSPKDAMVSAKTIALKKSSIQPSIQAVEKELMKRKEWSGLNLAIDRQWDKADLYVDIGFVHLSLITHRYVFTVYDRRSGTVIAAGETTSWGSLAENLARNITKSLSKVKNS